MHTIRIVLAYFIKNSYLLEKVEILNENESISINESLFIHKKYSQIWEIGLINNISRKVRFEIVEFLVTEAIKKVIKSLILIWHNLKAIIKKILGKNYILFLREAEYIEEITKNLITNILFSFDETVNYIFNV